MRTSILYRRPGSLVCAFLLLLGLAGCRPESTVKQATDGRRAFAVTGLVKALEADGKTVVIQHGAVSNFMDAMTMPFAVKDPRELRGLKTGDNIAFQMVITTDDGWIENITKLAPAPPADPASAPGPAPLSPRVNRALTTLEVGDALPDYTLTNEQGHAVSFRQYRGQVVAFTFFFTKCPFPTACPRLTANFEEAARALPRTPGAPPRWHLFSISFDTTNDSPSALKDYAARNHCDPAQWSFLSGDPGDIRDLADQFNEAFEYDGATIGRHTFRTVVADASGRVRKIIIGNTWSGDDLVEEMIAASK